MSLGLVQPIDLAALAYVVVATVITFIPAVYLMRKRLVK